MKLWITISLLCIYLTSFLGYGTLSLVHEVLHYLPEVLHHHGHEHHHGHGHSLADHSHSFEQLQDLQAHSQDTKHLALGFILLLCDEPVSSLPTLTRGVGVSVLNPVAKDFIKTWCLLPATPPPLS